MLLNLLLFIAFNLFNICLTQSNWLDSNGKSKTHLFAVEFNDDHDQPHKRFIDHLQSNNFTFNLKHNFNSPDLFVGASIFLDSPEDANHLSTTPNVKHIYAISEFDTPSQVLDTESTYSSQYYPHVSGTLANPNFTSTQSLIEAAHHFTGIDIAHSRNLDGSGIFIAFVDDGVDYNHPALGGCFGDGCIVSKGWDLVGDDYNTSSNALNPGPLQPTTCKSHGTSTLGIAAAKDRHSNLIGGAPNATFGMYRIFGCVGSSGDDVLAMGMIKAYEDGADIINVSAGGPNGWTTSLPSVVASRIVSRGKHVVTSAGNYGLQGLLYSNSPAGGIGVTPVASLDLPYVPWLNASMTISNVENQRFPYVPSELWYQLNTSTPVYILDSTNTSTNDACEPVNSTLDLSSYAVLIKNTGCDLTTKINNLKPTGAKTVVINNLVGNVETPPSIEGISTAVLQPSAANLLNSNSTIDWHYTAFLKSNPRSGLISQFSSMGPSADGYGKPTFSAPGANVVTLVPTNKGSYSIQSGTSFSAPYYSSMLALYLQSKNKTLSPVDARSIMSSSAQPVQLDVDAQGLAFTVLQGGGAVNVSNALDLESYFIPDIINLNDTENGNYSQELEIFNTADITQTFKLKHMPSLTGFVFNDSTIQANTYLPPYINESAIVSMNNDILEVEAHSSSKVKIEFKPPTIDDHRLPIYSGFIIGESDKGDVISASYNGIAGNLKYIQVLDNTDDLFKQGFPVPFTFRQFNKEVQNDTFTFSLDKEDAPAIIYRMTGPSPYVRVDLVDSDTDFKPTYSITQAPHKRDELNGALKWMDDFKNTLLGVPKKVENYMTNGILYEERGVSRNGFMGNGEDSSYQRFNFNGTFANGTQVPDGSYKLLLRALKVHGNYNDLDDYESWLSYPMVFNRTNAK